MQKLKTLIRNLHAYRHIRATGRFDPSFYASYSNSKSPLWHYITVGWRLGNNPAADFDTNIYLAQNPDVARSAETINPFLHYLQHGEGEARGGSVADSAYDEWIQNYEMRSALDAHKELARLKYKPLISIIVPCCNPDIEMLQACVSSVLDQSYENWELCISDDASSDESAKKYIQQLGDAHSKIRIDLLKDNVGIALNSNAALALAEGEFVALLDQDDVLTKDALLEVAIALNKKQQPKLIYSDEDKLDESGKRFAPHFKPDWNRDYFYSINYICHLAVMERKTLLDIEGFRKGYDGSQDYDLLLRFIANIEDKDIYHIPKILYRWRAHAGSTASAASAKSYSWEAGVKALQEHLDSTKRAGVVNPGPQPNSYCVDWESPADSPLVSLIIPTKNHKDTLCTCIDSILQNTSYENYEIVVVDNQSTCPLTRSYLAELKAHRRVSVIRYSHAFNYSAITNFAVSQVRGEYIGLVNNDIEVINRDWLTNMMKRAVRPGTGCVGAKLYYPDDTIQHAGVILGIGGVAGHSHKYFPRDSSGYYCRLILDQNLSAVTAACLVVKKAIFDECGRFDDKNLTIAFNDIDFCLKVDARGYHNTWTPSAELYHHESKSRGHENTRAKVDRFNSEISVMQTRWKYKLQNDSAYNPNLTLVSQNFGYKV